MKRVWFVLFLATMLSITGKVFSLEKGHYEAGEKVVKFLFERGGIQNGFKSYIEKSIKINPALEKYKEVIYEFSTKYYTYQELKEPLIKLYTDVYTEAELKELLVFYNSSLGKKMFKKKAYLNKERREIGAKIFKKYKREFDMMMDELKKNDKN